MEKEKVYSNTYFPPEVIIEAVNVLTSFIEDEKRQRTEVTRRITFKSEESCRMTQMRSSLPIIENHLVMRFMVSDGSILISKLRYMNEIHGSL